MYLKYFNSLLHLLNQHFSKCKIGFYIYKLYYLVGIFYVLFIYVLQGYFGNWTKKSRWSLKSSVCIIPLLRTTGGHGPDVRTVQILVFPESPLNGNISSRAYLKAFFQATRHQERTEREEIIPQRDWVIVISFVRVCKLRISIHI